jgi:GDP-4-dehydro-6-deoxy-D-mannose reductase
MRALVTGGNGFVGKYLVAALRERGFDVVSAGRRHDGSEVDLELELADSANVRSVVEAARPDVVFHLAGIAFVPEATLDPLRAYEVNSIGTARVVEALREVYAETAKPRLIYISSAEVYGARPPGEYPLNEALAPRPSTPYAASKVAGEAIALASSRTYGIPAIVTRAFNHIGPGQSERFALPSFARGLSAIANGAPPVLQVGNLETKRDFLDVRDAVLAYIALATDGVDGEIYNVCGSGPVRLADALRELIMIARVAVEVREDPALVRSSDNPISYGDNGKLRAATGWQPHIPLAESLRDVYAEASAKWTATKLSL